MLEVMLTEALKLTTAVAAASVILAGVILLIALGLTAVSDGVAILTRRRSRKHSK